MPNIYVEDFNEVTERAKFHEDLHEKDEQRKNAHIHFIGREKTVSVEKLSFFFNRLIAIQKEIINRAKSSFFFKVNLSSMRIK